MVINNPEFNFTTSASVHTQFIIHSDSVRCQSVIHSPAALPGKLLAINWEIVWQQLNAFRSWGRRGKGRVEVQPHREERRLEKISGELQLCGGKCLDGVRGQRSDWFEAIK